jgi:hypothetical protein
MSRNDFLSDFVDIDGRSTPAALAQASKSRAVAAEAYRRQLRTVAWLLLSL